MNNFIFLSSFLFIYIYSSLNQNLNVNDTGNHSYHDNDGSGELTEAIFNTMEHGIIENNHPQNKTDFNSFDAVNTLISHEYHPHATTHNTQHACTTAFI